MNETASFHKGHLGCLRERCEVLHLAARRRRYADWRHLGLGLRLGLGLG